MLANALVFQHFDYCSPVWSNCKVEYFSSLQILQNKLARVLLSADIKTSTDDLMTTLNSDKLEKKRWQKQLILIVFKCLKHDAPSYLSSKFVYTSSVYFQNTRNQSSNILLMPSFNIKSGKRTFYFRGSSIWNSLPTDVRCNLFSMSIQTFKTHVIF